MFKKELPIILYVILTIVLVTITISCIGLHFISYHNLVDYVLQNIHRPDLQTIIEQTYFPESKFLFTQKVLRVFGLLMVSASVLFLRKHKNILAWLKKLSDKIWFHSTSLKNEIAQCSKTTKWVFVALLIAIFIRSIYLSHVFYVQLDEAWNYNYFLKHNIIYTLFAYNNYPLHNLITGIILKILPNNTFTLRLSVIIFGLLSSASVFIIFKRIFRSEWQALATMGLFASLPVSIYYMLYARGVMINIFFLLWSMYFVYLLSQKKQSTKKIIFMSILNALATYSMVSHFYFIAWSSLSLGIYFFIQKKYNHFRNVMAYFFLSMLGSILVLSPFLAGTGIALGLEASITPSSRVALHHLPFHCYSDFFGGWWFLFYPIILLNLIFFFIKSLSPYRFLLVSSLIFILSIFIIKFTTHVYPPERALSYLIIPILIVSVLLFSLLNKHLAIILCSILILAMHYSALTGVFLNWSKKLDEKVHELANNLIMHKVANIYSTHPPFYYYEPGLIYYYNLADKELVLYNNNSNSQHYKNINDIGQIDCLVSKTDSAEHSPIIFGIEDMSVYLKR